MRLQIIRRASQYDSDLWWDVVDAAQPDASTLGTFFTRERARIARRLIAAAPERVLYADGTLRAGFAGLVSGYAFVQQTNPAALESVQAWLHAATPRNVVEDEQKGTIL